MRKGQLFLIGAIAAMGFMIIFAVVAMEYIKVDVTPSRSQALLRYGYSALEAAINSYAVDRLISDNDTSTLRFVLESSLPPNAYYNFTIHNSTHTFTVSNVDSLEADVTLTYVYTSVSLKKIYIIVFRLAVEK